MNRTQKWFHRLADALFAVIPRPRPGREKLQNAKIVSHRGEYDNQTVFENSLDAFAPVEKAGLWGIEFDIRWTKDLQPVVFHDRDLLRVFQSPLVIQETAFAELRTAFPQIPTLAEMIDRFGKKLHFMIEIKEEPYPDPQRQNSVLKALFEPLEAGVDYHLITLAPPMLDLITVVPKKNMMLVSELNFRSISRICLEKGYGGLMGHYLFISSGRIRKHNEKGQQVGTGYVKSLNCLMREINRGVEWYFSNNAVKLQNRLESVISPPA